MAIYSFNLRYDSRGKGKSSVSSCSYITGERMRDERTGTVYAPHKDPSRVKASGVMLAPTMPQEWATPERLVNECEKAVRQENAVVARKIIVALPRELDDTLQQDLLQRFMEVEIRDRGYGCVWAIHRDADNQNPHAHILIPDQPFGDGKWQPKVKTAYALDENGDKIPVIDKKTGKQKLGKRNKKIWVREQQNHFLGTKEGLKVLREAWASHTNTALERAGEDSRIDHRSYKDQGSLLEPTKHEGFVERRRAAEDPEYFSPVIYTNQIIRAKNEIILLGQHTKQREVQPKKIILPREEITQPTIILASDLPTAHRQLIAQTEKSLRAGQNWDTAIHAIRDYYPHSAGNIMAITGAQITRNEPVLHDLLTGYHVGAPQAAKPLELPEDWTREELPRYFEHMRLSNLSLTSKDREIRQYVARQTVQKIITGDDPVDVPPVPINTTIHQVIQFARDAVNWLAIALEKLRDRGRKRIPLAERIKKAKESAHPKDARSQEKAKSKRNQGWDR